MTEVFAVIGFVFVIYSVIKNLNDRRQRNLYNSTSFQAPNTQVSEFHRVRKDGVYVGLMKDEKNDDIIIGMILLVFRRDSVLRLPLPLNEIEYYRSNENLKKFFLTVNLDSSFDKHFNGQFFIKGNQISFAFNNQAESFVGGGFINGDSLYIYFGTQKRVVDSQYHSGCINFQFFQCV